LPGDIIRLNNDLFKEKPITAREIEPENIVKATRPPFYWSSAASSRRLRDAQMLRFKGASNVELTAIERQTPEWRANLDKYLLDIGMWDEGEEDSPADYLNKKSIVLANLIDGLAPKGAARDSVLKEYALLLSRNELRGEGRLQWFWLVRALLRDIVRLEKGEERAKMLAIVNSYNNPTIRLYTDLMTFQAAPEKPPAAPVK
jgi:hypothetical protein